MSGFLVAALTLRWRRALFLRLCLVDILFTGNPMGELEFT